MEMHLSLSLSLIVSPEKCSTVIAVVYKFTPAGFSTYVDLVIIVISLCLTNKLHAVYTFESW